MPLKSILVFQEIIISTKSLYSQFSIDTGIPLFRLAQIWAQSYKSY